MDKIIEELSKLIPFGKLFLKIGLSAELSSLVSLGITFGLIYFLQYGLKRIYNYYKTCKASQDLAPYFDPNKVKMSIKYFIPTRGQNFTPTHEEEPSASTKYIVSKALIPWFIKEVLNGKKDGDKFYLVLADSGMGKSTFMINLFMKYNSFFNFSRKYQIKLLPFGDERIIEQLKQIAKNQNEAKNTILLLDAFDEYKGLLAPEIPDELSDEERFKKILDEIFEIVRDFRDVIITSRTQYFPGQEDQPYELKVPRFDEKGFHKLSKLYLSPFNNKEIKSYLNKKYGILKFWNYNKKKFATNIVANSHKLMVRPMLLSYINYLVDGKTHFDSTFEIYNTLIDKWIEREANKRKYESSSRKKFKDDLAKFSMLVAIEIYKSRKHSLLSVKKEMAEKICINYDINLKGFEITGQSLLTKDVTSNWKFAHKSIFEYYIAKYAIQDIIFGFNLDLTGMDMTKKFIEENNLRTTFLYNYSLQNRNEVFIQKRNENLKHKQKEIETSNSKSYYLSKELVTKQDYSRIVGETLQIQQDDKVFLSPKALFTKYPQHYLFLISKDTQILSKNQAIKFCNNLNRIFSYKIQYNEFGKLVNEEGKKIRNITDIIGFRFPTRNEIDIFIESDLESCEQLKVVNENENIIKLKDYTEQTIKNISMDRYEWTHEFIGENSEINTTLMNFNKKENYTFKVKDRKRYVRLIFINQ